jgi:hypothetical protein
MTVAAVTAVTCSKSSLAMSVLASSNVISGKSMMRIARGSGRKIDDFLVPGTPQPDEGGH